MKHGGLVMKGLKTEGECMSHSLTGVIRGNTHFHEELSPTCDL
jgi:hypothetical protein